DSNVSTAWKDIVKPENDTKPTGTLVDGQTYSTYSYSYTTSPVDLSALYNTGTVVKYDSKTGEINGTSGTEWTVKVGSSTNGTTGTGTTTGGNITYTTPSSAYRTPSDTIFKSDITGMCYPNLSALQNVEGVHTNYSSYTATSKYSSTNRFFDPISGMYTSYSTNTYSYAVSGTTTTDSTSIYMVGSYYYPSYSAAYSAAGGNSSLITWIKDYTSAPTNYFSEVTGSFYTTYAAALSASGGYSDKVTVLNGAYDYYYGYPYYDYYYGYYNYNDPYYYYFFNKNNSSSSSSKDTTTATLGSKKGWKSIATYLKKVSAGSSATIDMNKETVIPADVMSAIKGRNVTLKFVLDNGVTFTVNGKDVTTAKDVDIDTTYNTRSISKKLIKAAYKKNDAVSSAQLSIDAGTLGFNSDLTVKFSAKRGGYKAKLYRYNASKNSLSLVDTATIGSTGKCNFDNVTKGGEFVIIIYK
ncbi:MAG: hypothetical protein IKK42_08060, partial [Oscillospiraceae bacterium]|nr:hypothetical protein [Oscillospiraceae bacterium]